MNIFIDTAAFYALADSDDQYHERAKSYYLDNYQPALFLSSEYVFVESWTLIHHKLGKAASKRFWETIRTNVFPLQRITSSDLVRAWEISREYDDQDFSLVDCTSFAIMERLKIIDAFTFDSHFLVFRPKTGEAIRIHPA